MTSRGVSLPPLPMADDPLSPTNCKNPFLSGVNTPVKDELTVDQLEVFGSIPASLNGHYLRIGPNPIEVTPVGDHWFSGDGMVHAVALQEGEALWYRNRWIRSRAVAGALGKQPAEGARHGVCGTVNTNVVSVGGRTLALIEAGSYPLELSATLDQQAYFNFDGTLTGSFSAHPHLDPLTGEHHAIAYEGSDQTMIRHVVIAADGIVSREEFVAVENGPSIHDCAITARFVVILDLPVTFSMNLALAGHSFPYKWNYTHQARIGLLPRKGRGDETIWIDLDPCYVFHTANAYDLPDGRVVLDLVVYDTMFTSSTLGPDAPSRGLERWIIDPVARTVIRRVVDPTGQEFPRMDERRCGQFYRYTYTLGMPDVGEPGVFGNFLLKHDLETGKREVHDFGPQRYPGEFVFIPAHPLSNEDEGWLMGLVVDANTGTTELTILDASSFTSCAVAAIRLPCRVPQGFHGNWIPTAPTPRKF